MVQKKASYQQHLQKKEIYRYSESVVKHLPKDALKMIQNYLLNSKKGVVYPANSDR